MLAAHEMGLPSRTIPRTVAWVLPLLAGGCGRTPSADRPGLATGEPRAEFGTVYEGALLEHEFALEVGRSLAVTGVQSDCGCTVARLEREEPSRLRAPYQFGARLAPGDRLFLGARYDTRGKRGDTPRTLTVTTATGERLVLSLSAQVRPRLLAEPDGFGLLRLRAGESAERSFRVRSAEGERFRLEPTRRGLPPMVAVELRGEDADDSGRARSWLATVRVGADLPRGTFSYPIELLSDLPLPGRTGEGQSGSGRFSVSPSLSVQKLGPVALSTPNLAFGVVRADETVARSVRLECFDAGFSLAEPRVRLEPLKPGEPCPLARTASLCAREVPGEKAFDVELLLAGLDDAVAGSFACRLVLETGHPELPRLEALVTGVRAPAGGAGPGARR